jgi:glycosyltransferase involved in cell wall biosynthesis
MPKKTIAAKPELTILMPCLNEAKTVGGCVSKACLFLKKNHLRGEVLVADNGSSDNSALLAVKAGARVIKVAQRGYGAALIAGTQAAGGKYIIMGDADDSYDFTALAPFVKLLRAGNDLVIGNRFLGQIKKGAMPLLHRYLGNPLLSAIGRVFFKLELGDWHCGLRGYKRSAILALKLHTSGMEYASEMIVQASLHQLKISEVPIVLSPDGRGRASHLRSWRDGWRHLKFLLIYSPDWLFLYPGLLLFLLGLIATVILEIKPLKIGTIVFDLNTLLYAVAAMMVGSNMILFNIYTKLYAVKAKFIPVTALGKHLTTFTSEKGIIFGGGLVLIGLLATISAFIYWGQQSFGVLDPEQVLRITLPALGAMVIGLQFICASFFLDILRIEINAPVTFCDK